MHDCAHSACEKFKPRPLFFQSHPFKALFLAKIALWVNRPVYDAKVSHSKTSARQGRSL